MNLHLQILLSEWYFHNPEKTANFETLYNYKNNKDENADRFALGGGTFREREHTFILEVGDPGKDNDDEIQ